MSTATLPPRDFTQEAFDAFLAARDEPAWLTDMRRRRGGGSSNCRCPSGSDEEWMRTDIRLFKLDRFGLPDATPHDEPRVPARACWRRASSWAAGR